jgi:FMN phosphatase YigB (HAD superfamily)
MQRKAVIFDFNRTLYDPETGALYPEAAELLSELSAERRLFLYSKLEGGRSDLLHELGIADHFEDTYFVEHKTPESIRAIVDTRGWQGSGFGNYLGAPRHVRR